MDKVFSNQICRSIEVYIDNMVVKSYDEETLLRHVEETFRMLAKV